jgi:hypothetical protein
MADPFNQDEVDRSITMLSAGVGVKLEKFFMDFAVNHSMTEATRIPYFTFVGVADPMATQEFTTTRYLMTVGFTF